MNRLIRIESDVRLTDKGYAFDQTYNAPDDIIDIAEPQLYASVHDSNIYRFGYRFNDSVDSSERTKFIRSVKQIGECSLSDDQLEQFIKRSLGYLNKEVNLYKMNCLVYPLSGRSPLVPKMIRCINDMTSHDMYSGSFKMVKQSFMDIDAEKFSRLKGSNILVVDDINTIGSTLNEILRKLCEINNKCNLYVYTLIGK